eukprot:CAMPEP_0197647402 /NCGR_PEP_ID=MMETSP1338-20131121/25225_1 /TAXON_ID=43686 ORGANISM="Pelagodinium beii, Strain RCC1491" /NCGR_SAMPLE_ID=MMETSP1338 /ASSEMBLY_ACC=CAM_ASM_000754 /LENGTH=76 /DNA_ID=CAMNT_0043221189 /DNA_START=69 /DNA_END=299 /DNA_ORIENTATION=+
MPVLTQAQTAAQEYVDEHGLDRMVTKMMNTVVDQKPEDPEAFMIRWLADGLSKEKLEQIGLAKKGSQETPAAEAEA